MVSKAILDAYFHRAKDMLEEIGATYDNGSDEMHRASYNLETVAGTLRITAFDDWIAARFDTPCRAKLAVDCNPHSGKWNFHPSWTGQRGVTLQDVIDHIDLVETKLKEIKA